MAAIRVHWPNSVKAKRDALGEALAQDANNLANQALGNQAIGQRIGSNKWYLQGLRVTIEYSLPGDVLQVEDVYENRA